MNYPVFNTVNVGGSVVIGLIATIHVLIAQFAVGGGLFFVLLEMQARREKDEVLLQYLRETSRWFTRVTLVLGASTGVGIWFSIGLFQPSGTSALIRTFVWAWGMEWVMFFVEIAALLVYYYGWQRLDARTHIIVGWIYFIAAWLSLFLINAILSFMLTPGYWLEQKGFAEAFFNPTMLPSLMLRTASSVALAGLIMLFSASMQRFDALRAKLARYCSYWVMAGVGCMAPLALWYISLLPAPALEITLGGAPAITLFAIAVPLVSIMIVAVTFLGPFRQPLKTTSLLAGIMLMFGVFATGFTELVREATRKPWIIYEYMYANALTRDELERANSNGALAEGNWFSQREITAENQLNVGRELYVNQCQACHTIDAYNGIRPLVKGWDEPLIDHQLEHLSELKGFMPPFAGNEAERKALARWLHALGKDKPFSPVPGEKEGP